MGVKLPDKPTANSTWRIEGTREGKTYEQLVHLEDRGYSAEVEKGFARLVGAEIIGKRNNFPFDELTITKATKIR